MTSNMRALVALHLGAFLWAFASTLLGPALPLITDDLGLGYAAGGSIFALSSAGFLTGSLLVAAASHRFGVRLLVIVSTAALVPLLYATSLSGSYPTLLTAVGLSGVAGGALTSLVNAGVSDLSPDSRASALSLLNVSFGSGALLAPLFAGLVISRSKQWEPMYQLSAAFVLVLLAVAVWWLPRPFPRHDNTSTGDAANLRGRAASVLLNRHGMITFVTVFLAAAVEWGFAYWSASYFADVVKASTVLAANMASLFWAGMLVGRLAFSGLLRRVDPGRTVTACAVAAIGCSALLALNAGVAMSVIGALLLGASLAAVIPSLLALAIENRPQASGTISGLMMFASGGGSLAAPATIGFLAEHSSLSAAIWLLPAIALALTMIHAAGRRATSIPSAHKRSGSGPQLSAPDAPSSSRP